MKHKPNNRSDFGASLTSKQCFAAILRDVSSIKWWLLLGLFLSVFGVILGVLCPAVLGKAVDILNAYASSGIMDWDSLTKLVVLLICLYVLSALLLIFKSILLNNVVSRHFTCKLRIRMSEKIAKLPVKYLDSVKHGEIIDRMTEDVSVVGNTVHTIIDLAIGGVLQLAAITAFMFVINPPMAAAVAVIIPLSAVISVLYAKKMSKSFDVVMTEFGKLYSHIEECYGGLKTVRQYGLEKHMGGRYAEINGQIRESSRNGYYAAGMIQPIISLTNKIGYIVICLIGGYLAISGTASVGDVVAIVLYAAKLADPLGSIAGSMGMFQRTTASAKRVYGLLATDEMEPIPKVSSPVSGNDVEFSHVTFGYVPEKPVLTDLCLRAAPGEKIAIVGATGGGKTTIVNLLMRFYDPDSGSIFIGGKDILHYPREDVRNLFSMVLQDPWLLSGTIAENLSYGKPDATREEIIAACREAYCDKFVEALPDGYDTVMTEDAANISGGQKQLLTVARAILSNRPMLILDEATSNVDTRTEILLQKAMDKLMQGRTSFVIAHRLSTIVNADKILVLDGGKIAEQGTHTELLEKNGVYCELYHSQYAIG